MNAHENMNNCWYFLLNDVPGIFKNILWKYCFAKLKLKCLQGNANTANTGTITQEHIKASILSAVEDKVPVQDMDGTGTSVP